MNLNEIIRSPLTQTGASGSFLRLVLAECAGYGMPAQVIATLDDVAAMLGFYEPLPGGPSNHLAGPFAVWRTDRRQPTQERIPELEQLALKQRALIAFGGAPENHRVGTAEIVVAMGNTHREICPPEFLEIFEWASVDVLATLRHQSPDQVRKERNWLLVSDDDVLKPGGRLNSTYQTMADHIRRTTIAALRGDPESPREYLRSLAQHFLTVHQRHLEAARRDGQLDDVRAIEERMNAIRGMYPDRLAPPAAA